ncbi:hypothetical protein C5167_035049, partial [Papaver somniferum]
SRIWGLFRVFTVNVLGIVQRRVSVNLVANGNYVLMSLKFWDGWGWT